MRANLAKHVVVAAAVVVFSIGCQPQPGWAADPSRTDWLAQAHWGVMTHYLGAPPSSDGGAELTADMWNAQVDAVDVEGLAKQLASTGAKYLLFTLGQNSGHYCAPNATYDKLVGISPSKCSRRDLIADLARALKRKDIRLMVYLPSGAPAADHGGAITYDVPIQENGLIPQPFVDQLRAVGRATQ